MFNALTCPSPFRHHFSSPNYAGLQPSLRRSSLRPFTLPPFTLYSAAVRPPIIYSRLLLCPPSTIIPPLLPPYFPTLHSRPSLPPFTRPSLRPTLRRPSPIDPPPPTRHSRTLHSRSPLCHASPCIPPHVTRHFPTLHSRPSLCRPSLPLFKTPTPGCFSSSIDVLLYWMPTHERLRRPACGYSARQSGYWPQVPGPPAYHSVF
jgi:hypothetical protein